MANVIKINLIALMAIAAGCNASQFGSGTASKVALTAPNLESKYSASDSEKLEDFEFGLVVAGGAQVIKPGVVTLVSRVGIATNDEGSGRDVSEEWVLDLLVAKEALATQKVGASTIDLSAAKNVVVIDATFKRTSDGRIGRVSRNIFVDVDPPVPTCLSFGLTGNDAARELYWAAMDNYGIDTSKSKIIACTGDVSGLDPLSLGQGQLPSNCVLFFDGSALSKASSRIPVTPVTINGVVVPITELKFAMFAQDKAGNMSGSWADDSTDATRLLLSSEQTIFYTKAPHITLPFTLKKIEKGQIQAIDSSNASNYRLVGGKLLDDKEETPYSNFLIVSTNRAEGPYEFEYEAKNVSDGLVSNRVPFTIVVDRKDPIVADVMTTVEVGFLEPTTVVGVSWRAEDENGIASQHLDVRKVGTSDWSTVKALAGTERSTTFIWGNREKAAFEIRVRAEDLAGNVGSEKSAPWFPQVFNAAVLTSTVNCFFCHMRIEGDVAGINFPASVHGMSGQNLDIKGTLYATGSAPDSISTKATATRLNYNNQDIKMFPKNKDENGIPEFPELNAADLKGRMNGTLVKGDGSRYQRVINGNLVVTSTADKPFVINGEVFVDGDLIIRGVYKGIGTIYARNIFIVGDIVANDCITIGASTCPYPFTGTEEQRIAKAKEAVAAKRSALYLGAINQLLVGDTDSGISLPLKEDMNTQLYIPNWLTKANLESYGTQADFLKLNGGDFVITFDNSSRIINPRTDPRVNMEVNRVDAYLYGHDVIAWRSYANFVINGGFMGKTAALMSSIPHWMINITSNTARGIPVNPRNGERADQNVIRYDYRLKVGGTGFEALKAAFN